MARRTGWGWLVAGGVVVVALGWWMVAVPEEDLPTLPAAPPVVTTKPRTLPPSATLGQPTQTGSTPVATPGAPVARATPETAAVNFAKTQLHLKPGVVVQIPEQLDAVRMMLRDFRSLEGENPVGTNAEVTRALKGANRKGANLLAPDAPVNERGELVDPWGTPFFFHQLGGQAMEIRSAGPDRQHWTGDDQVAN